MSNNIHFITYGNEKFALSKKRILKEADEFGEFATIKGYGPEDLPNNFKQQFKDILSQPRGGGYWIWRPKILMDTINKINNGDYLVYLDAGCKINPLGKKRFFEYINMLENSNYGILSFQMSGNNGPGGLEKEKYWTIKEVFEYFNVKRDGYIGNSGQYIGGVLIMKKNKHLLQYMEQYMNIIYYKPLLCTDYFNETNQSNDFIDNRHEQSISSILRKIHGSVVIDGDESWMQPFGHGKSLKYPFWACRIRN